MKHQSSFIVGLALMALALFVAGCEEVLGPEMTYQGRLTDASGNPLNGSYTFIFRFYHEATGGTHIYEETEELTVTEGLFDTVVGPSAVAAGLAPEDLTEPLWLEVTVGNGVVTETLEPRQRLYGAPYAFTLMPGAYISSTMDSLVVGSQGIDAVVTIQNSFVDDVGNEALPALRLSGYTGLELTGGDTASGVDGTIYTDKSDGDSDLVIYSNDLVQVYLDHDNNDPNAIFRVYAGDNSEACRIEEDGDLICQGTITPLVNAGTEQWQMYAISSPDVVLEDFGTGTLTGGVATVSVDPLFAKTVNLGAGYHVFLTPLGDCNGLYVANKTATGFEVRELNGGTSNISFDYRIVARRAGYEDRRMELFQAAESERE